MELIMLNLSFTVWQQPGRSATYCGPNNLLLEQQLQAAVETESKHAESKALLKNNKVIFNFIIRMKRITTSYIPFNTIIIPLMDYLSNVLNQPSP